MKSPLTLATLACLSLMMASCEDPAKVESADADALKDAAAEVADLKSDHKKELDSVKADLESAEGELETLRLELLNATEAAKSASEEIEQLRQQFEAYKAKYRVSVREKAKGEELGDLVLANGRTLKSAVIREIDDTGIMLAHAAGIGRIAFTDLSPDLQDRFAYDPDAAAKQANLDAAQQAALRQRMATAAQATQSKNDANYASQQSTQKLANNTAEISTLRSKIAAAKRRITAIRSEISDRQYKQAIAEARGRSASHSSPIKKLEAEKQRLESAISQANVRISQLQSGN